MERTVRITLLAVVLAITGSAGAEEPRPPTDASPAWQPGAVPPSDAGPPTQLAAGPPSDAGPSGQPTAESGQPSAEPSRQPAAAPSPDAGPGAGAGAGELTRATLPQNPYWGEFNPGKGFKVAATRFGELNISGYMVARYLNQLPAEQEDDDHLDRSLPVSPRQDFQFHRVLIWLYGYLFDRSFNYLAFFWTVQDTNQVAIGGALSYDFSRHLSLGLGWNAYPGTISLQGSHPYWTSFDRVLADEFFRPFFSQGVFAAGEIVRGVQYKAMLGNNLSNLDVQAVKLGRNLSAGGALVWLPTTGEFGPRGGWGDFEDHRQLALRFGVAFTYSPEIRHSGIGAAPVNTTLRLADSLNVFETGALAPGVTVTDVKYYLASAHAGLKWRGLWLQGEGYYRVLDDFRGDGPLPVDDIENAGFYVQAAYMVVPKTVELYGATSWVFGDAHPDDETAPHEFLGGASWYWTHDRNLRLNLQVIGVFHSPVNSTFGFYTGGLHGPIVTLGATALY